MIAVTATKNITIPRAHGIALVFACIFNHKFFIKNMRLKKEITLLIFIKPGIAYNDLVKQSPRILISQRANSFFV